MLSLEFKTIFVITVLTSRMFMPGAPDIPKIPGMEIPGFNEPSRTLSMNLTSDKKADSQSKAEVMVPEGLRLGPKVQLTINLPGEPGKDLPDEISGGDVQGEIPDFTMKLYWKSSEKVLPGQPKVITSQDMNNAIAAAPKDMKQFKMAIERAADGSYAYWPGHDFKQLDKKAETPGSYTLTTNYCGGTTFSMEPSQNFLDPISLVGLDKGVDMNKSIKVQWKPVKNAVAYLVTVIGSNEKEMITWTSSTDPDVTGNIYSGAISKAEMKKYLDSGILLPPTTTTCYIPEGIFKNTQSPMLMITAYGNDTIQQKDGIETQIVVRSNATAMLSGPIGETLDEEAIKSDVTNKEGVKSNGTDEEDEADKDDKDDSKKDAKKNKDDEAGKAIIKKGIDKLKGRLGL